MLRSVSEPPRILLRPERVSASIISPAQRIAACWHAPVSRIAVENPVMHRHARARLPAELPAPQIMQPHWFGEPAKSATGFYLRGLPQLEPTNRLPLPAEGSDEDKRWQAIHRAPPGPDRWKFLSRTFEVIAAASSAQWGGHAATEIGLGCPPPLRRWPRWPACRA